MKKAYWSDGRSMLAVFSGTLFLNLSIRSVFYNFDGVACAIAVELSDFKHLVHGNHLAYGVVGWCFDRIWRLFGYQGQALLSLQALDAVLGAAGAAVFSSLLRRMGRGEREAILGAAALAVSHAWWFWSLEAQVYMLGCLFACMAAREALSDQPRPGRVGLWHAFAILGHVGHVMAFPAYVYALTRKKGRGAVGSYMLSSFVAVTIPYLLAGYFAMQPSSFNDVKVWLLGSAALTDDRSFLWHSVPIGQALHAWSRMTFRIFTEFVGRSGFAWTYGVVLAVLPILAAGRAVANRSREAKFWLLWLAGYAVLFLAWEPFTIVYRVSDLIGLLALATLGLQALPSRWRLALMAAWVAGAFVYNLHFTIRPASLLENNPDLVEAEWTKMAAPPEAWMLVNNRGVVYIPYFTARRPVNLRYLPDEKQLHARLDSLIAAGQVIFVSGRTLEEPGVGERLERYGLKATANAGPLTMFRVIRKK